jgi:uncharacterized SAM-binding protein YcdF (DUF218 family)
MQKLKNTIQNNQNTKQTIHKTKNTISIQNKFRNKKCLP